MGVTAREGGRSLGKMLALEIGGEWGACEEPIAARPLSAMSSIPGRVFMIAIAINGKSASRRALLPSHAKGQGARFRAMFYPLSQASRDAEQVEGVQNRIEGCGLAGT